MMLLLLIFSLFLLLLLLMPEQGLGHNQGNCQFTDITEAEWNSEFVYRTVITDRTGLTYFTQSSNPISLLEQSGGFLEATVTLTFFITVYTKNLTNLDWAVGTTDGDIAAISSTFTFRCPDGNSTLKFVALVMDINDHAPLFGKSTYEFLIPKNLTTNKDLMVFGDQIIVHDYDFSTKFLQFNIYPKGVFMVETKVLGNKSYSPVLKLKNNTDLRDGQKFELIATDDSTGKIQFTSRVNLTFKFTSGAYKIRFDIILFIMIISLKCF